MFIKEKEIKSQADAGLYDGTPLVELEYTDGTKETRTAFYVGLASSEKAIDHNLFDRYFLQNLTKNILVFLKDAEIRVSDINSFTQLLVMSVNQSLMAANDHLWGKSDDNRTLLDVDKVVKTIPEIKKMSDPMQGAVGDVCTLEDGTEGVLAVAVGAAEGDPLVCIAGTPAAPEDPAV